MVVERANNSRLDQDKSHIMPFILLLSTHARLERQVTFFDVVMDPYGTREKQHVFQTRRTPSISDSHLDWSVGVSLPTVLTSPALFGAFLLSYLAMSLESTWHFGSKRRESYPESSFCKPKRPPAPKRPSEPVLSSVPATMSKEFPVLVLPLLKHSVR